MLKKTKQGNFKMIDSIGFVLFLVIKILKFSTRIKGRTRFLNIGSKFHKTN